jgi:hypothetical protein
MFFLKCGCASTLGFHANPVTDGNASDSNCSLDHSTQQKFIAHIHNQADADAYFLIDEMHDKPQPEPYLYLHSDRCTLCGSDTRKNLYIYGVAY